MNFEEDLKLFPFDVKNFLEQAELLKKLRAEGWKSWTFEYLNGLNSWTYAEVIADEIWKNSLENE